jgi:hypothetical protein
MSTSRARLISAVLGAVAAAALPAAPAAAGVTHWPAGAKPDGGLRVDLHSEFADAKRLAVVDVLPTRSAERLEIAVATTGVARVLGRSRATLRASTSHPARFTVPWEAGADGSGTIVARVRSRARHGSTVAFSRDTLFVLRDGGQVATSARGPQDLQLRQVDQSARRGLLSGLQAALRRDALLGAGATTTSELRATAAKTTAVSGTVQFMDADGGLHPVRQAPVEVRQSTLNGSSLVATTQTGDDGAYAAALGSGNAANDLSGRNLFVRVLARGPGFTIDGTKGVQRIDSRIVRNVKDGADLKLSLIANNVDDNNTAFSVGEALLESDEYVRRIGRPLADIVVDYPTSDITSNFSRGLLHILRDDRFDTDVIQHEHGHYATVVYGIEANPGGPHSAGNLSKQVASKDKGIRLAWGEAVATYFGASLQQVLGESARGIPGDGDTLYTDGEDATLKIDIEGSGGEADFGEDGESAVIRFLWDLFDSADDPGDAVSLGDTALLDPLIGAQATTLSAAYKALVAGRAPRDRALIGCVAAERKIGPVITRPANGAALSAEPPTLRWIANGAAPYLPSDRFVVQFYDATFTKLLHAEGADETTLTLSPGVWKAIRQGSGGAVNIIVRGIQTLAPQTGPYDSCAVHIGRS